VRLIIVLQVRLPFTDVPLSFTHYLPVLPRNDVQPIFHIYSHPSATEKFSHQQQWPPHTFVNKLHKGFEPQEIFRIRLLSSKLITLRASKSTLMNVIAGVTVEI
jgi:hypothetical protein